VPGHHLAKEGFGRLAQTTVVRKVTVAKAPFVVVVRGDVMAPTVHFVEINAAISGYGSPKAGAFGSCGTRCQDARKFTGTTSNCVDKRFGKHRAGLKKIKGDCCC
jgi:hypothetical protein